MANLLKRINFFLSNRERSALGLLVFATLIGGGLEVLGVGIILPFLALLNDPASALKHDRLKQIYDWVNPPTANIFLMYVAILLLVLFVLKNLYLSFTVVMQNLLLRSIHRRLATRLFRAYLYAPYARSLQRNSAQQIRNIGIVVAIIQGILYPLMTIATEIAVVAAIFAFVVWLHPLVSFYIAAALATGMGAFYVVVRKRLRELGKEQNNYHEYMMRAMQQGLGSIKETKILGREAFFQTSFENPLNGFLKTSCFQNILSQAPRFYIEAFVVSLIMVTVVALLNNEADPKMVLASLSVFAVAAVRLMPSLGRISTAINSIRFYIPSLDEVYNDLTTSEEIPDKEPTKELSQKIDFLEVLNTKDLGFTYEGADRPALQNVNLEIKKNQFIGLAGPSGAGKTTFVDLLLGLLSPKTGTIFVDKTDISTQIRAWQNQIGYIPQTIYLTDDSIRNNVALGIFADQISDNLVWKALELAQLAEFVRSLPDGLSTTVGEKGARLSGGQRQRIGIARALYHEPDVLVMDEATSALDQETEKQFMGALVGLAGKKTIIVIAHRLATLKNCDRIYYFENGTLMRSGSFSDVFQKELE